MKKENKMLYFIYEDRGHGKTLRSVQKEKEKAKEDLIFWENEGYTVWMEIKEKEIFKDEHH